MRPDHFQDLLGATFVRTSGETILVIGSKSYDKFRLGEIGVPQASAARTLNKILKRKSITTIAQLAKQVHELLNVKGFGHASFYAALAVIADGEYEDDARADYASAAKRKHGEGSVTFGTMKQRGRRRSRVHARQTNPRTRRGHDE